MSVQDVSSNVNASAQSEGEVTWQSVCHISDLINNSGVCALVKGEQIAIFCIRSAVGGDQSLYALGNYDPIGKANVMSRGILGTIDNELVIASPLYKQHFSLLTGKCIELPEHALKTYSVRVQNDDVQISL